ncbi:hypothetical protein G6045_09825 [Streptomyces sp. YC504]|uniref:Uncharacterized protein n=1 Tax=Streptomyces mesophilus TaxID=1775132 RepID=A0A6G4XEK6_9ACTN|nr:hypothetical protein [Streptomyces mesophilus]NGO75969.1 hypothetical protein [Streptomyces mesophilus]
MAGPQAAVATERVGLRAAEPRGKVPEGKAAAPDVDDARGAGKPPEPIQAAAAAGGMALELPAARAQDSPLTPRLPETPTGLSSSTARRIRGVQARAGAAATAHRRLPGGTSQVGDAREAVTEPAAEGRVRAERTLIAHVHAAPSAEIVALAQRIRQVIRDKRPPDEDALMTAEPEEAAANAGDQLNASIGDEIDTVRGHYGPMNESPEAEAPAKGRELAPQPEAVATVPIDAQAAVPDAVPADAVSLDEDAADSRKKVQDAGMSTPVAELVRTGPVAEARTAQGELDQVAAEDPVKVLAGQKQALARAEGDMAALQARTLAALETSRERTSQGFTVRQAGLVGSEEMMRGAAAAEAQQIFADARALVNAQLKDLPATAMAEWDSAKDVLAGLFRAQLKPVQDRVDARHSGVGGFFVGVWDAVTGLPKWAEDAYAEAEHAFAEGVISKLCGISTMVNAVIAACDLIIEGARARIDGVYAALPETVRAKAEHERAQFDVRLDQLHHEVTAVRDDFTKDLVRSSSAAVDEVRAEISELRTRAGGLLGRIVGAVARFTDDPVKFLIEGLLDVLGIPPASFWAVVARIKSAVRKIADDPLAFATRLLRGLGDGFGLFFQNFGTHMIKGFLSWLLGGVKDVQIPKDLSLRGIVTFFLQLMGITWPNIRKILAKLVGAKNVALAEKVYSMVSLLIEKGPEGIYEMIKEKLDPQSLVDQVVQLAVDFLTSAIIKQATVRILALFNPAGAILQALEAIYRVLKWIFQNAARLFSFVETVVNGITDILAGNTAGFAQAVEKSLATLVAPVVSFLTDYLGLGDLPAIVADKVKSMREWVLGLIERALTWLVDKGRALLAALGIGKKKEKEQPGTPHEKAVREVADELAKPSPEDEGLDYKAIRAKTEQQAATIVVARNESLAAEHVKMSVAFEDPAADAQDQKLDFTVTIAPNNANAKNSKVIPASGPFAGPHKLTRAQPVAGEESHHVPANALGTAIGDLWSDIAAGLRSGWKGDPDAEAVAAALTSRKEAMAKMFPNGEKLSAIMLSQEAHRKHQGVHSKVARADFIDISTNPATKDIILVKRRIKLLLGPLATYVSVNPRTSHWRVFLGDVHEVLSGAAFRDHTMAPQAESAADLTLRYLAQTYTASQLKTRQHLEDHAVKETQQVVERGVNDAYKFSRIAVASAMERTGYGDANKQADAALVELDAVFQETWPKFYEAIEVTFPP